MALSPATMIASLRSRPAHERRVFAAAIFIALAFAIIGIWVASLERTLSSISNLPLAAREPASGSAAPAAPAEPTEDRASAAAEPPAPLAALKEAFTGTIAASRELIAKLKQAEPTPAIPARELAVAPATAGPAELTAVAETPPAPPPPAAEEHIAPAPNAADTVPAVPATIIAEARTSAPYSPYAAARLLSSPVDPGTVAQEPERQPGRIAAIIFYNLTELRRTAGDVYEYFAH